jgi:hypothetical protein
MRYRALALRLVGGLASGLSLALIGAFFLAAGGVAAQGVQGVFASSNVEVYGGYTYFRFYEAPHLASNMNGFNFSAQYFPRDWIALDGEVMGAFGSQAGTNTRFFMGVAGPRVRWTTARGIDLWAHAMGGGAYLSPQTPYGSQGAFAFEVGGGADLSPPHRHVALRVSGDLVGTSYFSTYQFSPKVSAGLVFKF